MVSDRTDISPKGLRSEPVGANIFDGTFPFPTAVLVRDELEHNIATMARYCGEHGVLLAPHAKTSMCPQIIGRQHAAGAWAMTVATAWQAQAVAAMGIRRLIVANEVVDRGSLRLLTDVLHRYDNLEVYSYVDSLGSLTALEDGIAPGVRDRLHVLIEIGVTGGRAGLRDDAGAIALARRVSTGPLGFAGVAAFEGLLAGADLGGTLGLVDELLDRMTAIAVDVCDLVDLSCQPIVTAGGSSYFDRVVGRLPAALSATAYRVVLRSGCYATHDAGSYDATSPFGAHPRAPYQLREALLVWAPVLARPESGLALAGLGRRDAGIDAGLPVPRHARDSAGRSIAVDGVHVTAVNDQHAYLSVPPDSPLAVGDLVAFGISHPCTTFDKWRAIPIVDIEGTVVEVAETYF